MESQKQERGVKKIKRVTKIIALASIFFFILSFLLSYSSLISSLQQRLHLISMYINLVDKKYMFLLCNGIVGFIVGNFKTLLHGKAINNIEETKEVSIKDMRESEVKKVVAPLGEKNASKDGKEEEQERVDLLRGGEEEVTLVVEDDDDEGILVQDLSIIRIDDHDDDGAEINDSLFSSENLNKKCDDFIRKVKAEIRFESPKLITF